MKIESQHQVETHKGVLNLATEAFKYLALANGGAALVVLSKASIDPLLAKPLAAFATGLMVCGFAIAIMLAGEMMSFHRDESDTKRPSFLALSHGFAALAFVVSAGAFAYGCGAGVEAIELGLLLK